MSGVSAVVSTAKRTAATISEKNVTFMAAGIAYNAFISLAPTLLLLLLVVNAFGGGLESRLVAVAQNSLPGPIADVVESFLVGDDAPTGASAIGLVALVWGSLKVFRGLDTAFSEIYGTEGKNSLPDQFMDGVVVLVALVVAIVVTTGASAVFARFADRVEFLGVFAPLVVVGGLIIAFLPMYYRFPDADLKWREVVPGVLFAAVGWALLQGLFQVYLLFKGGGSESFFGGVIVVVTWLYFSGLVLLAGAVLNAVIAGHTGVGQGSHFTGGEAITERNMDRTEFASYLETLREDVTGHYAGMKPTAGDGAGTHPRPLGDVEVVEHRVDDDEYAVRFQWATVDSAEGDEDETK